MKRILSLAVIVFWGFCAAPLVQGSPASSGFVHAQGKDLVTPDGRRLLLRGINIGSWLEPAGYMFGFQGSSSGPQSPREIETLFNELIGPVEAKRFWREYRDRYITEEDFRFLSQTGINSIRVPLHYKYFLPGNEEGFTLVDRVVGWAAKYNLYVILDLHCAPGGQTGADIDDSWGYPWLYESEADQELTIEVWKRIATHYSNNTTVLGYDLLNEPIPHYPRLQQYNERLEPLYRKITAAIRTVDENHVVILGGAQWDSNFDVFGPPFDKNVAYTFHKYWTESTEAVIRPYLDFRDRYGVPIWLGESGENTNEWIREFVKVLEKNEVGWAFWPYKKINAPSSFVTWSRPPYWDEIMAYAKTPGNLGDTEKRIAARPSLEHSRAAFAGLLEAIEFRHCVTNPGYLQALGLKVPERNQE